MHILSLLKFLIVLIFQITQVFYNYIKQMYSCIIKSKFNLNFPKYKEYFLMAKIRIKYYFPRFSSIFKTDSCSNPTFFAYFYYQILFGLSYMLVYLVNINCELSKYMKNPRNAILNKTFPMSLI